MKKQRFFLDSHPAFLYPLFIFVILQETSARATQGRSNSVLRNIGKGLGRYLAKYISERGGTKSSLAKLKNVLAQLPFFGLGGFQVARFEKEKVAIKNIENPIAKQYRRSFDLQEAGIDHFTLGMMEGICSELKGANCTGKEVSCIAKEISPVYTK